MASLNKVFIMGRLGQDPELRYTSSQTPVCTLNVATSESWTRDGQKQEQTEWHRVVVWNKAAENCSKYLAKGRAVFVEGKIQTRSWDDKNGQKRYTTEISANNVQFMPSSDSSRPEGGSSRGFSGPDEPQANSFPPAQSSQEGAADKGQAGMGMSLDDIPF